MNQINIDLEKILHYLSESKIVPSDVLPITTSSIITNEVVKAINEGCELDYDELKDGLYIIYYHI